MNISELKEKINLLRNKKFEYLSKVQNIEKQMEETKKQIAKLCLKENNNDHKWTTERDDGPYGERFTFCEKCGIDYYDGQFHF